ncbi:ATP-binding cassette domain-containing protein [Amycolatopsis sp. NPDC048633]|uniref:ABC transporter ATP-binding protein n=1 Tax=Amycolatopsis sp. NPDC048633 TaxID=3157095 RepID=UPI00340144AD
MIEAQGLTKRYGPTTAVDGLSFAVKPGVVTGFVGPNGAGKSTTMRLVLGLDAPSAGTVTVGGKAYADLAAPLHEVGALLDATAVHGARTAYRHLQWVAQVGGVSRRRVDEVLDAAGLTEVAGRRIGTFSLGMCQRLGIATALLGDPPVLLLDEPLGGLDPEGIRWVRTLLRGLADEGRTVFVSSHLMTEMEETAEHLVVIGAGRLVADLPLTRLTERGHVRVRTPRGADLAEALSRGGATVSAAGDGALVVAGMDAARVGDIARARGIGLHELTSRRASLETAFLDLTRDTVRHRSGERAVPSLRRASARGRAGHRAPPP